LLRRLFGAIGGPIEKRGNRREHGFWAGSEQVVSYQAHGIYVIEEAWRDAAIARSEAHYSYD
jgi:hypothetical protein